MAEPKKKVREPETPDEEADKRRRKAERLAEEGEEKTVSRAVEKRFLMKEPPRQRG
ncbi:MAG: hypothetical protein ACYC56_12805 [Candidatus Aquicultor sp.]